MIQQIRKQSLRRAIDAKCKECIYDKNDVGTWRQQVERCTGFSCPLFEIRPRPFKKAKTAPIPLPVHSSQVNAADFTA